jgi:siroheme synthase (precorrin-2 oxidase/ferrochelatase)|nr:MAG TPA: hypothetical protein [Caudoviricetes sp.]
MPLMVIASFVRMEAIMSIPVGLNWQKRNGHKFTKQQVLRVAVGCAGDSNMTARSIRKRLGGLFGNQWSELNDKELNLCINCIGSVFIMRHIGKRLRGFSQKAMCDMEFIC